MLDFAYERDVEIADVDEPERIARPRVDTKELTVHVIVEGWRHRRHASTTKTSCGEHRLHAAFAVPVREEIVHPLSRYCGCFTRAEIAEADDAWRSKYGTEPP